MSDITRRQFLAGGFGAAGAIGAGGIITHAWSLLGREDLIPSEAPTLDLTSRAWTTTSDRLSFATIGDNGSGGRQAMAVAERMARTYQATPSGSSPSSATSATTARSRTASVTSSSDP